MKILNDFTVESLFKMKIFPFDLNLFSIKL